MWTLHNAVLVSPFSFKKVYWVFHAQIQQVSASFSSNCLITYIWTLQQTLPFRDSECNDQKSVCITGMVWNQSHFGHSFLIVIETGYWTPGRATSYCTVVEKALSDEFSVMSQSCWSQLQLANQLSQQIEIKNKVTMT